MGGRDFSLLESSHACSGAHPTSYSLGIGGGLSVGVNWPGHMKLTTNLHLVLRLCPSAPQYTFMEVMETSMLSNILFVPYCKEQSREVNGWQQFYRCMVQLL
jgi:hypothetical protein